jgi:L-rhamnose mutarotase
LWPEILAALKEAHIQNNSTFVNDNLLFMYLEYSGSNFASDWKKYGENPKVVEWFSILKNYQEPYEQTVPPFKRSLLEEAFHVD